MTILRRTLGVCALALLSVARPLDAAAASSVHGVVRDATGAPMPGVVVDAHRRDRTAAVASTISDDEGRYAVDALEPGVYRLTFRLIGFATSTRDGVRVAPDRAVDLDVTLQVALSADVTVTAKDTFVNLAEIDAPEENLVGMASSASQGAVTARRSRRGR